MVVRCDKCDKMFTTTEELAFHQCKKKTEKSIQNPDLVKRFNAFDLKK